MNTQTLNQQQCDACRADAPRVTEQEANELQQQIPDWERVELDGVLQLRRVFRMKDFVEALAFANRVGELAEQQGHHPALLVEYGQVTVRWWTHKIGGLHRNDFIMAARTDQLQQ
ncbi:4a-hydroxytetrahydrobiopterin dehydratase [Thiopseudomonas denitrificans]|uniref:Putative pterin-4-alpha-carbinolamine dehydratase n=1 Tax=Thiopseudomonas denitrificans TaxID=1501432 RepID=A0A4R6U0Y4_9GAMM|nr:4a-hydroxytetrahydrobiopterin dehydratase [Thiopseudomonas denitrificans]TDQ39611.1 4a-hydroxytetrahydrobiopterin dehydratase [Thiopseudomonas denitrificans]